jgi:molybdopterin-biosynthesis enzyme MoeA-like protein
MVNKSTPPGFGLIIIGSEILDGRIQDSHFENTKKLLFEKNYPLIYSIIIIDDPVLITEELRWAIKRPEPFLCCGGIGSTPDDYTRQCAAKAFNLSLEYHEEGVKILKERFGERARGAVLQMVEFPKGSVLIPNPFNQVPGFSIGKGYFLPGFPSMAGPMIAWILDTYYETGEKRISKTLILPGAREADLVEIMETFIKDHPLLKFSSLPRFVSKGTEVRLGIVGNEDEVEKGLEDLTTMLDLKGYQWQEEFSQ